MKFLKTLLFALFACAVAHAERPTPQSVEKLLDVMQMREMIKPLQEQMKAMVAQMGADPATAAKLSSIATWENLKDVYMQSYEESFTQEEVDGMIAFYQTPIGRSVAAKLPAVTQNAEQRLQAKMVPMVQQIISQAQSDSLKSVPQGMP